MDPTYKGLSTPIPTRAQQPSSSLRKIVFFVGGISLLVLATSVTISLLNPSNTNLSQRLLYRLDALGALTTTARASIRDDAISKVNADLSIVLASDSTSIKALVPTAKSTTELTAIKTEEADAATTDKLKTALVNGVYDLTYKNVLKQKVNAAKALAVELSDATNDSKLKQALSLLREHLNVYDTQLTSLP